MQCLWKKVPPVQYFCDQLRFEVVIGKSCRGHFSQTQFSVTFAKKFIVFYCFMWISVIYYNRYTRVAIIRVKRGLHNLLIQTMALISHIKTTEASFRTVHVAGLILSLQYGSRCLRICWICSKCLMLRLHLIHVVSTCIAVAVYMYPVSATKLLSWRHVSTCIRIQVARPRYL